MGFIEWTRGAVIAGAGSESYEALERHDPRLADSLRVLVRNGSWEPVGGWWSPAAPTWLHGESLIRQGLYGQSYIEGLFGARAQVAWFPDSRVLPSTLPQILSGSGIDFLIAASYTAGSSDVGPRGAFEWIGNDGTDILGYAPFDYGDFSDFEFEFPGPVTEIGNSGLNQLALYGVREPGWEATAADVPDPSTSASSRRPVVRFALPGEAFGSIRSASERIGLPVLEGTLRAGWSPSSATSPGQSQMDPGLDAGFAHRIAGVERGLRAAEALATVAAGLPGALPYPHTRLKRAWRQLLSAAGLLTGASRAGADLGGRKRMAEVILDSASHAIDSLISDNFASVREEMDTREAPSGAYVLFNPLGQNLSGAVYIEIGRGNEGSGSASGADAREMIPIYVADVPAFGAVTVPMGPDGLPGGRAAELQAPAAGDLWMENAFLRVEIDPASGAIARILDKTNRRQALAPDGRANVLRVIPENVGAADRSADGLGGNSVRTGEEITRVLSLSSSVSARAATITLLRGWGNSTVHQRLVLPRAARFLEVQTEIDWHDPGFHVEAIFESTAKPDSATIQVPYGAQVWGNAPEAVDSPEAQMVGRWIDAEQDGYGLAVISDRISSWRHSRGQIGVSMQDPPKSDTESRRRASNRLRFAIYPHSGNWIEAGVHKLAVGFSVPLLSAFEPPHAGRLGSRFSLFAVDHEAVTIEWLKRSEAGDAVVLRLLNQGSMPAGTFVHSACPRVSARRGNHLEDPGASLPEGRGGFGVSLRSREIATVLVQCDD